MSRQQGIFEESEVARCFPDWKQEKKINPLTQQWNPLNSGKKDSDFSKVAHYQAKRIGL